jgi:two-component system cell cycle response regulator
MMDIDHFKSINDRYGHQTGDAVLREVSTRLRSVLRQEDLLARLGGEEFAVLLGGLAAPEVLDVGERLLLAVSAAPVATAEAEIEVRISIGAAQRCEQERLNALMQRADAALYAAKSSGRNRLVQDFSK